MSRVWKVLIALAVVIAIALTLNTITTNNETKGAETTVEGAEILELSSGDVQVVETPAETEDPGAPIVLLHCYACSLHWWDSMVPTLAAEHRVIRLDLLGFGGSSKPATGYSIGDQASLTAEALSELQVQGAVVVGHSMGASVAAALAEQSSELVDRVVDIDAAPDTSEEFGPGLPFLAKLAYTPVIGQLVNRIAPDSAIESSFEEAFAPGYDISSGFENPDQVVDDVRAMTYTSFRDSHDAIDDFTAETPLDERFGAAAVPLLVIFGEEDQIAYPEESIAGFEDVPGVRTATVAGAGHSPNVEKPEETARLILEFAADAGDEVLAPVPEPEPGAEGPRGGNKKDKKGKDQPKSKNDKPGGGQGPNKNKPQGQNKKPGGNGKGEGKGNRDKNPPQPKPPSSPR